MVYPKYIHRLLACLEFTKYRVAFWTQLLKAVREQGSISREVKIRKELPKDSVETVLQLLRAGTTGCVCNVEGTGGPRHSCSQGVHRELLYIQSTELKGQRLSLLGCYFLFILYLWHESQHRECHLSVGSPHHCCFWERRWKDRTTVTQETSSEIRKETSMSSLSGHISTASHGNVKSAVLSPLLPRAEGEPALTVQPCSCCWAWTNGQVKESGIF